jgi:hypothetical protein
LTTFITKIAFKRIAKMAEFPHTVDMPKILSVNAALFATKDLIQALENPALASQIAPLRNAQLAILCHLAIIFEAAIHKSNPGTALRVATNCITSKGAPHTSIPIYALMQHLATNDS